MGMEQEHGLKIGTFTIEIEQSNTSEVIILYHLSTSGHNRSIQTMKDTLWSQYLALE